MRKLSLIITAGVLCFMLSSGSAQAFSFQLDVGAGALGYGDTSGTLGDLDTKTGLFSSLGISGASLISQNDSNGNFTLDAGDSFIESNVFYVDGFQPGMSDTEGLNLATAGAFEITGTSLGMTGSVTSITDLGGSLRDVVYTFDPGALLTLYIDTPDFPQDPMNAITLADGVSSSSIDTTNYADGTPIATATLVSGIGSTIVDLAGGATPNQDQGSVNLTFKFNSFYDDMWLDSAGVDFRDYPPSYFFMALPAMDIDGTVTTIASNRTGTLFDAKVRNDGSSPISVIPEPASMLLFGSGMLGFIARRKKRNA